MLLLRSEKRWRECAVFSRDINCFDGICEGQVSQKDLVT
jgi:hypothetical protein